MIIGGLGERQVFLKDTDDHVADDVDKGNQDAGDGVAANELGGAVHGAVEIAFVFKLFAPRLGLDLVDEARREIRIDRHLLARHGVEAEAGGNLRDSPGTLGDDDEVNDHQNGENDNSDDEITAHDKVAEGFDNVAGGVRPLMAVGQDQPRRGQVERQTQHRRDQQNGWKRAEIERPRDELELE